jgi:hypothetical protein
LLRFWNTGNKLSAEYRKLRKQAKVSSKVKFEHLRDGAASNAKADELEIKMLLGHAFPGKTDAYVLRHPDKVKDACRTLEEHYFGKEKESNKKK